MTAMLPQDVDDARMTFPVRVLHLMPKWEEIPDEFKRWGGAWQTLFSAWFFKGLTSLEFRPKEGINVEKAMRHLRAIMTSFEPRHEHKMAALSYLADSWFEGVSYEVNDENGVRLIGRSNL